MHLQSSLQCLRRYVCTYDGIHSYVDLLDTCAWVETYYMYKLESWYKLRGGRVLVQIIPLQDFGVEMGGGGLIL